MKRIVSLLMSLVIALGVLGGVTAIAAEGYDTVDEALTFNITGTENYDYAQSVILKVNALRESVGVNELTLDLNLTEIAMQRAAEISIYYSHTRPDDRSCFSFPLTGSAFGENIAIGYGSPSAVMNGWENSSGHYANMVSSKYNAIGIGCFVASDGTLCWVQYFAGGISPTPTSRDDFVKITRTISAKIKNLDLSIASEPSELSLVNVGDRVAFSVANRNLGFSYQTQKISSDFTFTSSKKTIVDIKSNGVGTAKGSGITEITATLNGEPALVINQRVTVGHTHIFLQYFSDNNASCVSDGTKTAYCEYTGCSEKKVVTDEGTKLSSHSYEWITTKKATVYSAGLKEKKCSGCGRVIDSKEIEQLKCSKPTMKSIENTQYGVLSKWGKVKGADKYYVYRKASGGSYSRIASTTNTYYTDKAAESGTKYYYMVKAINEAGASASASALSRYYLEDTILNTPSSTSKGIGLRWSAVTGAEGYKIYRKTADGSYKLISTEKGVDNLVFRDTTAEKGVKYTYKVKAYYSKTYSAYSNTKSITDKY